MTSSSIDGLEGLTSELQELQGFLKSEVERVHAEIESALAGIKIILETIAPWKSNPAACLIDSATDKAINAEARQRLFAGKAKLMCCQYQGNGLIAGSYGTIAT